MTAGTTDIAGAEMEVLVALWRLESGTVRDVMEELRREGRRLAYTTVLTLMSRLERKGHVVRSSKDGLALVYRPRITREKVLKARLDAMVRQLGDGEAGPLVLQLVQAHKLSTSDIQQLRELLGKLESEARGR